MPLLVVGRLSFGSVLGILTELLSTPSGGTHEQFVVAALLHALVEQTGPPGYRVETKSINASDQSASTAADIQILTGNRTIEAFEATANDGSSKSPMIHEIIRRYDLSRLHIVAGVRAEQQGVVAGQTALLADDVSVLELRGFVSTLLAALTRQFRGRALERLYEYLDRYQSEIDRVNAYVDLLRRRNLVDQPIEMPDQGEAELSSK